MKVAYKWRFKARCGKEYKTVPLLEYKPNYINNTKYNSKTTNENTYKIEKGQSYDNLFSSRYGNI